MEKIKKPMTMLMNLFRQKLNIENTIPYISLVYE